MNALLERLKAALQKLDELLPQLFPRPAYDTHPSTLPMNQDPQKPVYLWDTPDNARHSLRLIADEEGLTVNQKNMMSSVVHCESGYNVNCVHPNVVNGKTVSTDFGICQWNDYYHGKEITPDDALHNPEKAVRLMCQYVKTGKINQWVCYSKGLSKYYSA